MISIIIPCFNAEKYLEECFESIKNQTYKDYEIIFIDDGSTDNTGHILEKIKYDNMNLDITVHGQDNKGVSGARNAGISLAKGEYLSFIDADDYVSSDFLETLYLGLSQGDMPVVGVDRREHKIQHEPMQGIISKDRFIYMFFKTRCVWGYVWNKLYKKEIIIKNNIRFDEEIAFMEDMLFNIQYCRHIDTMYVLDKNLYYYRLNDSSATYKVFSRTHMAGMLAYNKINELELSKEDKRIIKFAETNFLLAILRTLYKDYEYIPKEETDEYEREISFEFSRLDKKIFLIQGWKKGFMQYMVFLLCLINPKILRPILNIYHRYFPNKGGVGRTDTIK